MTTSSRYDEAADAVVVLEGPTSVDTSAVDGAEVPGAPGASDRPASAPAEVATPSTGRA